LHLAQEVARARPRLVVFGHIHVGYGREIVRYDAVRVTYEEIIGGWKGWGAVLGMAISVMWSRVRAGFSSLLGTGTGMARITELVNASVVGGKSNKLQNEAIVVLV